MMTHKHGHKHHHHQTTNDHILGQYSTFFFWNICDKDLSNSKDGDLMMVTRKVVFFFYENRKKALQSMSMMMMMMMIPGNHEQDQNTYDMNKIDIDQNEKRMINEMKRFIGPHTHTHNCDDSHRKKNINKNKKKEKKTKLNFMSMLIIYDNDFFGQKKNNQKFNMNIFL